ncbi:hypothetical protein [Bacillus mycoides]|uniref:hypothetical protein n=1 Tax=Bacillus mycoides TaxID=1405 RepID=UPI003A811B6E
MDTKRDKYVGFAIAMLGVHLGCYLLADFGTGFIRDGGMLNIALGYTSGVVAALLLVVTYGCIVWHLTVKVLRGARALQGVIKAKKSVKSS